MSIRKAVLSRALLPAAIAFVAAGCTNKDNNPTGATQDIELDAATVGQQSVATLDIVNGLIGGVDEFAAGDFTGVLGDLGVPNGSALREEVVAVWDATTSAWVVDMNGTEADEFGTVAYDVYFWVQFRDGAGAPQQNPDDLTAAMQMSLDFGLDLHSEDQGTTLDLLADTAMDMTIGGLPAGPYSIDGSGDANIALQVSGDGENLNVALGMAWAASLTTNSQGCPAGTANVNVEGFRMDAVYDGQGGYSWELREGAQVVGSGNEFVGCDSPPAS